ALHHRTEPHPRRDPGPRDPHLPRPTRGRRPLRGGRRLDRRAARLGGGAPARAVLGRGHDRAALHAIAPHGARMRTSNAAATRARLAIGTSERAVASASVSAPHRPITVT